MKVELIFWTLALAFNGLADRIQFYPEQFKGWWKSSDSREWKPWQFLISWVQDGWHFSKMMSYLSVYLGFQAAWNWQYIMDWKFHLLWAAVAYAAHEIAMKGKLKLLN